MPQNYVPSALHTPVVWPSEPNRDQVPYVSNNQASFPYIYQQGQAIQPNLELQNSNFQNTLRWTNTFVPNKNTAVHNPDKSKSYLNKLSPLSKTKIQHSASEDGNSQNKPEQYAVAPKALQQKTTKYETENRNLSNQNTSSVEDLKPRVLYQNTEGDTLRVLQPYELSRNEKPLQNLKHVEKSLGYLPPMQTPALSQSFSAVKTLEKLSNSTAQRKELDPVSSLGKNNPVTEAKISSEITKSSTKNAYNKDLQAKMTMVPYGYQNLKLTEKQKKLLSNMEKLKSKNLSPMSTVFDISTKNGHYYHYILNMGSSTDKKPLGKNRYFSTGDALLKLLNEAGVSLSNDGSQLSKERNQKISYEKLNNNFENTISTRRNDNRTRAASATEYSREKNESRYDGNFGESMVKENGETERKLNNSKVANISIVQNEGVLKSVISTSEPLLSTTENPMYMEVKTTTMSYVTEKNKEDEIHLATVSKPSEGNADNLTEVGPMFLTIPKLPLNMLFVPLNVLMTSSPSPIENQMSDKVEISINNFPSSIEHVTTTEITKELNETSTTSLPETAQLNRTNSEIGNTESLVTETTMFTSPSTAFEDLETSEGETSTSDPTTFKDVEVTQTTASTTDIASFKDVATTLRTEITEDQKDMITSTESTMESTPFEVTTTTATLFPATSNISADSIKEDTLESPFSDEHVINGTADKPEHENSTSDPNAKNISDSTEKISTELNLSSNGNKNLNMTNPMIVLQVSDINDLLSHITQLTPELATVITNRSSTFPESENNATENITNNFPILSPSINATNVGEYMTNLRENSSLSSVPDSRSGKVKASVNIQTKKQKPTMIELHSSLPLKSVKNERNNEINEINNITNFQSTDASRGESFNDPAKYSKKTYKVNNEDIKIIDVNSPQSEYSLIHPLLLENGVETFLEISPDGRYSILEIPSALEMQYQKPANLQSKFLQYLLENKGIVVSETDLPLDGVAAKNIQHSVVTLEQPGNSNDGSKFLQTTEGLVYSDKSKNVILEGSLRPDHLEKIGEFQYTLLKPELTRNINNNEETRLSQNKIVLPSGDVYGDEYILLQPEFAQISNGDSTLVPRGYEERNEGTKLQYQNQEYYLLNDMISHSPYQNNSSDPGIIEFQSPVQYISGNNNPEYQQLTVFSSESNVHPAESQTVEHIFKDSYAVNDYENDLIDLSHGNTFSDILRLNYSTHQNFPVSNIEIVEYVPVETASSKAINFISDDSNKYLQQPVTTLEEYSEVPDYRYSNTQRNTNDRLPIRNIYSPDSYSTEQNTLQTVQETSPVFGSRIQDHVRDNFANRKYLPVHSTAREFKPSLEGSSNLSEAPWKI